MDKLARPRVMQPDKSNGDSVLARLSRNLSGITLLAVLSVPATTVWAADDAAAAEGDDVLVTEFRGRPPFKRQILSSDEVAELARFEEAAPAAPTTTETIRVTDFRGKPPYKREIVTAEEWVELARFEETSASEAQDRRTRRGPPGKLNSRR